MKIVLIHGQNHRGSSYNIARLVVDKIEGEKEISEFFLPRDLNHFCLGCYKCVEGDANCPFYAEKSKITDAVEAADLIIFSSPTYCLAPSAALKSFLDMTFSYWMVHRPRECMFSKRAIIVAASAGSSTKQTIKPVKTSLVYWGVPAIKCFGLPVQANSWGSVKPEKKAKAERRAEKLARWASSKKTPHVGIKTRFLFKALGMIHKKGWDASPIEAEYWREKGWLDKKRPWKKAKGE